MQPKKPVIFSVIHDKQAKKVRLMKTIRIQIVEDDADYRYLMERTLRKEPR